MQHLHKNLQEDLLRPQNHTTSSVQFFSLFCFYLCLACLGWGVHFPCYVYLQSLICWSINPKGENKYWPEKLVREKTNEKKVIQICLWCGHITKFSIYLGPETQDFRTQNESRKARQVRAPESCSADSWPLMSSAAETAVTLCFFPTHCSCGGSRGILCPLRKTLLVLLISIHSHKFQGHR